MPSVGMKLSVKYPPLFATYGFAVGNKFRNQTSNALPKLFPLFQCAAKPEKYPAGCAGYSAHASQYPNSSTPSAPHCQRGGRYASRNRIGYPSPICDSVSSNV